MLLIRDGQRVLLQQRPPTGIWGGLWSLPECPLDKDPHAWGQTQLGLTLSSETRITGHQPYVQPFPVTYHSDSRTTGGRDVQNHGAAAMGLV